MYLAQVESIDGCTMWLSVPVSVVNSYLPLSPSMKLRSPSISWLHKYSFSVTRYRVRIGGKTPTHCQWVLSLSLSTVSSERRCLRQGSSNLHDAPVGRPTSSVELPAESAGLLCISEFIGRCGSNLKDPTRKTCCCAENDRFRSRRHGPIVYYVLRVRTQLHLHSTHAWSLISSWIILGLCFPYNLFYFCVNHCLCATYCEVNQIQKHKLRFVVVNNTSEIVTIWSVWERKTSSWRHDVKFARHMDGDICLHRYGKF